MSFKNIDIAIPDDFVYEDQRPVKPAVVSNASEAVDTSRIGELALQHAVNAIAKTDGNKWENLRKQAFTMGGYIPAFISFEVVYTGMCNAINEKECADYEHAHKTIKSGLHAGMQFPFDKAAKEKERQAWLDKNYQDWSDTFKKASSNPKEQQEPNNDKPGILERLSVHLFNVDKPVLEPVPVISIEGNIISTNGNITSFCGASKVGKTGIGSAILGGLQSIPGDVGMDTVGITVKPNTDEKAVLHIDTEQSKFNHYKAMQSVLKRCNRSRPPDWFYSYSFRELEIKERLEAVKALLAHIVTLHKGIYLIFIDGIADFVKSVNDEEECNLVVHFFEKLAIEYNCPVVTILHFNPGTEKGRGHLGSQLERKSESVLSVSKDKDTEISTIEGKFLRNAGLIPKLQFLYDVERGYHVFAGIKTKQDDSDRKLTGLKEMAEAFFTSVETLKYALLCEKICDAKAVSIDRAKQIAKDMLTAKVIEQESRGVYRLPKDFIDFSDDQTNTS